MSEERISKLEQTSNDVKVRLAELHGDIVHIKTRIDNGMGKTIHEIAQKLDTHTKDESLYQDKVLQDLTEMKGAVKEHAWWINSIRVFIFTLASLAVTGGLASLYMVVK